MPDQPTTPAPLSDDQLIQAAIADHGDQGVWWVVKRINNSSRTEETLSGAPARVYGPDFDEHAWAQAAGVGNFIRRLKVKGQTKTFTEERFTIGQVVTAAGTINVPGAGMSPLPASDPRDQALREALEEIRRLRAGPAPTPTPAADSGSVGLLTSLIAALSPIMRPPTATPLKEQLETLQLLDALRGERTAPGAVPEKAISPMEWVEAAREGMPLLRELIVARRAATPAPQPARQVIEQPKTLPNATASPATPPAPVMPARAPTGASDSAPVGAAATSDSLDAIAATLLRGAKRYATDPHLVDMSIYAGLVDEELVALDFDVERLLQRNPNAGDLVALIVGMRPDLQPASPFLLAIEKQLRVDYSDDEASPAAEAEAA